MITAGDLAGLPTLAVGQDADLKVERDGVRVWIVRDPDGYLNGKVLSVEFRAEDGSRWTEAAHSPQRYLTHGTKAQIAAERQLAERDAREYLAGLTKARLDQLALRYEGRSLARLKVEEMREALLPAVVGAIRTGTLT